MDPNTFTLLQNAQAEFGVPLTVPTLPEPQCLLEVLLDLWQGLLGQRRLPREDPNSGPLTADSWYALGQACGGRFPGVPAHRREARRVRRAARHQPCITALPTPPPDPFTLPPRPSLPAEEVAGAAACQRRWLDCLTAAPEGAADLRERLLRLARLTYGCGRQPLRRRLYSPLASLGPAVPVAAMPAGDTYLLTEAVDREQRERLSAAIVALLRGEADWYQTFEALGAIDDSREPVLYEVAGNLAAIASSILADASEQHARTPEGRRYEREWLRGAEGDEAALQRGQASLDSFLASSELAGRRATSPEAWEYLPRLLAALKSSQPLAIVTFTRPSLQAPPQAAWRPFWTEAQYEAARPALADLRLPEYEQIGPLYRQPSRLRQSWRRFLGPPCKPTLPRALMLYSDSLQHLP